MDLDIRKGGKKLGCVLGAKNVDEQNDSHMGLTKIHAVSLRIASLLEEV